MKEAVWLDKHLFRAEVQPSMSKRKARLYASEALRRHAAHWKGRFKTALDKAIEAAYQYADGLIDEAKATEAEEEAILAIAVGGGPNPVFYVM